ncbi:hypothetical protein B0T16DRAFT_418553 [Cercophora newfieldiana]|uniref:Uncharacterized protein n=1 Tax=Cercophora newfieldiana TaxID=92897 RepID=A0AA39XV63_9PEZI|nr:hypothetical protein B0T16DRAFT_418553 [Cercophora newfieldiana]
MAPSHVFKQSLDFAAPVTSVAREAQYNFYGALTPRLVDSAADFIIKRCAGDQPSIVESLSAFIAASTADEQASTHSCWFCIRLTHPTDEYVLPRWHNDGRMFDCSCAQKLPHSKYAVTLLGPPTRLLPTTTEIFNLVQRVVGSGSQHRARVELAEALKGMQTVPLETGQMIRFSWGQEDSPIHSEPDSSDSDRVFVSILFGSEEEIRCMANSRDEVYGTEKIYE